MKKTQEKKILQNTFFDLCALALSFLMNILRALVVFGGGTIKMEVRNTSFFTFFDFFFTLWPKDFWNNPNGYRFTRIVGDFLQYLFLKR